MNESKFTKKQIDFIKLMGNPYAKLSYTDDITAYIKQLENPYAKLSELYKPCHKENNIKTINIKFTKKLSKKHFQLGCRDIFLQYIPSIKRKHIRPEHREFITRNQSRSPEERYALLNELQKYDLTTSIEYRSHFNREREELTERKLKAIEKILEK